MFPQIGPSNDIPSPVADAQNFNGKRVHRFKNGSQLYATYSNGVKHGPARYIFPDGKIHDLLFICDRPIQTPQPQNMEIKTPQFEQMKQLDAPSCFDKYFNFDEDSSSKTT